MVRAVEERAPVGALHGAAGVHHEHVVGDLGDEAEIVRDQDDRGAELGLQAPHQVDDLRLHGDVERRRRLVRDQQLRIQRQRHRDHRPLPHAARELVRVVVDAALGPRDPDEPEQLDRPLCAPVARDTSSCTRIISAICQPTR